MKYTIARHKAMVAKALLVGWLAQAAQAHNILVQNEKDVRAKAPPLPDDFDLPMSAGDFAMLQARKEVFKAATDFLIMRVIRYDDVPYFLRRLATFATSRPGRSGILLGGIEATLSVK